MFHIDCKQCWRGGARGWLWELMTFTQRYGKRKNYYKIYPLCFCGLQKENNNCGKMAVAGKLNVSEMQEENKKVRDVHLPLRPTKIINN